DGKMYNTYLYNQRGIMEICRWSRQPIADKFMDWVWDIIEAYRDGNLIPYSANVPIISLTQEQIETIIDDKLMHFKQEYLSLNASNTDGHSITPIQTIVQSPIDVIRTTIDPLAKALNDNSKGYNCTFRKVYAAMNISWKNRLSRYQHQHNNKNKPSKLRLIADNPKLLKLFVDTVSELMESIEQIK
ncbi:MAG: hypothetical protein ACI4DS_00745, partial [Eubacterium sp.]